MPNERNNRTVLVTGGAGYVGSHVVKALAADGYTPVVFDNFSTGHRHNVKWGPCVDGDVRDADAVEAACREHGVGAVMHFAAAAEVAVGERNPAWFYDNNVNGALALFRGMRAAGVNTVIFSSTCAVYGVAESLPLREDHPRAPTNVYGRTKNMVEQILADYARSDGDFRYAALRYFNAAGADMDGEIGEEHEPETHLIPNALRAAWLVGAGTSQHTEQNRFTVFGTDYDTPDGSCLRDYIHVHDLARAHILALGHIQSGGDSLQLNLGTGRPNSVMEVIESVRRVVGCAPDYVVAGRRPGDVAALYADASRARDLLGFTAEYTEIDTLVASAWAFHEKLWNTSPPGGKT